VIESDQSNQPQRVLVTGGAGFIGSALLPMLLDQGTIVRILDVFMYGAEPIQPWMQHPRLELVRSDFRDPGAIQTALQDVDSVVHLGAIVGDPACDLDEGLTVETNLIATQQLAETARAMGVRRFILASTGAVYGASDEDLDENSELRPVSLYARSKIAAEKVLMALSSETFSPGILRFGTVYGISGRVRFDLVVNLLTAKALIDHEITVFGGDQWRTFIHVEDAARAVQAMLEAPLSRMRNQVFNAGSSQQNYTILEVGELIHALVPAANLLINECSVDRSNYRIKCTKIQRELGFVPQWTVEQGIRQVMTAIHSGRISNYRDPIYSNVKFLSQHREWIHRFYQGNHAWAYEMIHSPRLTRL
jgi:nucleoside-diphosphate-sugar epimerase